MKAHVLSLTSLLVLAACGTDFEPTTGDDTSTPPQPDPVDGGAVFRETCAQCHGAGGDGGTMGPQILSPVVPYATYVIHAGRDEMGYQDPMPTFTGELTDAEITAVLAWLSLPAKPTDGAGLYRRFCGNCHGADAWGGRVGKDITSELDEAHEKVREGHGGTRYGDREEYMPAWSPTELTDAEVALITGYIASLPPGPGDDDDDDDHDDD